jgi:hypothetical protein
MVNRIHCPAPPGRRLVPLLLALLGLTLAGQTSSPLGQRERLRLPSGEVLVGIVVGEEADTLVFRSDGLGTVRVARTPDLIREPFPLHETPALSPAVPSPRTERTLASSSPPAAQWTRKLEAGLSLHERGEAVSAYAALVRGEVRRKEGPNDFAARLRYLVGVLNDERSEDRLEASLSLRHHAWERFLLRSDLSYRFDRVRRISNDLEATIGVEARWWKGPRLEVWMGPGLTLSYSEPKLGENGYLWLGDLSSRLNLQLGPRLRFEHRGTYLVRFDDLGDYRLRLHESLRAQVSENLNLGLRYEYDYESTRPVADGRSEHRVFTTVEITY